MVVFWVVVPCSLVEVDRHFRGVSLRTNCRGDFYTEPFFSKEQESGENDSEELQISNFLRSINIKKDEMRGTCGTKWSLILIKLRLWPSIITQSCRNRSNLLQGSRLNN
jgi:hypothetical protein